MTTPVPEGMPARRGARAAWFGALRNGDPFRNWDLPQRRQIFAGIRLAQDAR